MSRENTLLALTHAAWAYFLLHFSFNLGTLDILPDWGAYALIATTIPLLPQLRDLPLLKPFAHLLVAWSLAGWGYTLFTGSELSLYPLSLIINVVALYFHFQFLTNLADLAAATPGAEALAPRLRRLRTAYTLFSTAFALFRTPLLVHIGEPFVIALVVANMAVAVVLIYHILLLREPFKPQDEKAPDSET